MAIYLGGETKEIPPQLKLDDLTPRQIVAELDRYVVGQANAKRAVAVALRNRIRRKKLPPEIARDVLPKKYFNDRFDRSQENRNRQTFSQISQFTVYKNRSLEIYRSRLCRARCRKYD